MTPTCFFFVSIVFFLPFRENVSLTPMCDSGCLSSPWLPKNRIVFRCLWNRVRRSFSVFGFPAGRATGHQTTRLAASYLPDIKSCQKRPPVDRPPNFRKESGKCSHSGVAAAQLKALLVVIFLLFTKFSIDKKRRGAKAVSRISRQQPSPAPPLF